MMLGRLAAASRIGARTAFPSARPNWTSVAMSSMPSATRSFAAKVHSPKPLSIRGDGLFIQCVVAALIYFVPQDLVFLGGLFWCWHHTGSCAAPKVKQADAEAAVEEFKAKKGLDKINVSKGRSTWYLTV
eukprot:TRINITY_DN12896_c0_g3_i1.p1 TRINITY_DN12896_c0_g3~~TRINITY_DN12896_c0_g3_i1.p1  ORF type:complete len:130 (+),score=34.85 TRINITY_DN12896_c0_g3_i1:83-472(+)